MSVFFYFLFSSLMIWKFGLHNIFDTQLKVCIYNFRRGSTNNAMIMCSVSEGLSVIWGITAVVCCWFSRGSMQEIGQKVLGRIHLNTSMFLTEQFYCMIIIHWKHLVLSSWHSNHLYSLFTLCIVFHSMQRIWNVQLYIL